METTVVESHGLEDLVFGVVAPIGTDLNSVSFAMSNTLRGMGYDTNVIQLSSLLTEVKDRFQLTLESSPEEKRYETYMTAGNAFREAMRRGDALSMLAVGAIGALRSKFVQKKRAFILRSLKHPDEVKSLRNIYGPAFVLFSINSSRTTRVENLAKKFNKSHGGFVSADYRSVAENLINRDQQETGVPMGQNVRRVFSMADFFVDADSGLASAVKRMIELFMGNVFTTPTRDEYNMFFAHAAAARSASLQRQVGAVISSLDGNVISVGTNEVPKPGGGLYWEGDESDSRDFRHGGEINDDMKHRMFVDVIQRVKNSGMNYDKGHDLHGENDPGKIANWLLQNKHMENARITSIIEFGRCVHAEMAAIMDAARRGVAVNDSTLYSTTFPCHECARHIVAAGIRCVHYIEPYPKSLVNELYPDSIQIEGDAVGRHVQFVPFVGVAPRRYLDVFKLRDADRKTLLKHASNWDSTVASPQLGEYPKRTQLINLVTEKIAFDQFRSELKEYRHGDD